MNVCDIVRKQQIISSWRRVTNGFRRKWKEREEKEEGEIEAEETEARSMEQRENKNSSRDGMRKLRGEGSDSEPRMSPAAGPRQAYRKRDDTLRGCCTVGVRPDRTFAVN